MAELHGELVDHLVRTTRLPAGVARRVVDDVVAYFGEPVEALVRRRHRELQAAGRSNAEIFDRIAERGIKHICWDGCMFANEVLEKAETWEHILKAMVEVDEAL